MFWGAFCSWELLVASRSGDITWVVWWSDVTFGTTNCVVWFRKAKNDQRARDIRVRLGRLSGSNLCPVQALEDYRQGFAYRVDPLLQHEDRTPLTVFQFRAVFRLALINMGYPASTYGLHSLQIGATTLANVIGMPASIIRRIGCWRSDVYKLYIRK